jgi:hypothetical protein
MYLCLHPQKFSKFVLSTTDEIIHWIAEIVHTYPLVLFELVNEIFYLFHGNIGAVAKHTLNSHSVDILGHKLVVFCH